MKVMLQTLAFKEGVILKHAHFMPHMAAIFMAALETAPVMEDGRVVVTQATRNIRDDLDFHQLSAAIDFRCKSIVGDVLVSGERWADRMSDRLGPDYDCIAHGSGDNFHLHVEFDPR